MLIHTGSFKHLLNLDILHASTPYYKVIPSEARSLLGSRVVSYGFWAYLSRASKFSFLLSSATQATSPCVADSKAVASLKMVMQGL